MIQDSYIKEFIQRLDPKRGNVYIEGTHKDFTTWLKWYEGTTAWHRVQVPKGNRTKRYTRMSSGIAKLLGEEWASNYANEETVLTVKKESENKFIQNVLTKHKVFARFGAFAEKFLCLGIGATVVMPRNFSVDKETGTVKKDNADIEISFINANRILPVTVYDGVCTECAFVKYGTNSCTLDVHILIDDKYVIGEVHGTNNGKGDAWIFDWANAKVITTNDNVPFFQLWKYNAADNKEIDNSCYCSIYGNAIDTFKQIDIIYDAWYKEFRNSSKKRFISTDLTEYDKDGNLVDLNPDDEEYVIPKDVDGKNLIQEFNGEIRQQSLTAGLEFMLNYAGKQCGLGTTKFAFSSGSRPIQTATGVIAKETEMYRNVIKQENFATENFRAMLMAIKFINNEFTNNPQLTYEPEDIEVVYDDNIVEDTQAKRQRDLGEVEKGIMSIAEYRATWYDEDVNSATEFLQENGLLIDKYMTALQAGAISPEKYCELVYGNTDQLEYIKSKLEPQQPQVQEGKQDNPLVDESDDE